jgi:hypothetical protein
MMKKKFPIITSIIILVAIALVLYDPTLRKTFSQDKSLSGEDYTISEFLGKSAKAATIGAVSPKDEFIKGMDSFSTFSYNQNGESGAGLRFSIGENSFTAVCLWFNGSTHIAIEDSEGKRSLVFSEGALTMPSSDASYPKIGFSPLEKKSNRYMLGIHDFTDDGYPEFLITVNDGDDGIALFVLEYRSGDWTPIGEIVSAGEGLGGGRIFRQAFTLKDSTGILHSWTWHTDRFDYLCSENPVQKPF